MLAAKGTAIDPERKALILRAVEVARLGRRAAERVFGVARQTVAKWLGKKAEALPSLSDTRLPAEKGDVLELDELWSFVGSKANPRGVWIALCRQTRQVVAYFVGDRSAQKCPCFAYTHPSGLPLSGYPQRLVAGVRRGLSPAYPPLRR